MQEKLAVSQCIHELYSVATFLRKLSTVAKDYTKKRSFIHTEVDVNPFRGCVQSTNHYRNFVHSSTTRKENGPI